MNMQILPLFECLIYFFFILTGKEMLLVGGFHSLEEIGGGFTDLSFLQFCFQIVGDYTVVSLWITG